MQLYEILKFSAIYRSNADTNDLILLDDRKCVKNTCGRCRYILADIEPVTNGIHCWRVNVKYSTYLFIF